MKPTTARGHLEAVVATISNWVDAGASDEETAQAVHDARNFLQLPADLPPAVSAMEPKAFQQEFCMNMVKAASAQELDITKAKGVKLQRFYIENMRGACNALTILHSDQANGLLWLFVMVCTRGAEVVHAVAEGKPIP